MPAQNPGRSTRRPGMSGPLAIRVVAPADWPHVSGAFRDLTFEQSLTYGQAAAARIGGRAEFVALDDVRGQTVAAACIRIKCVPGLKRGIAWIVSGPLTAQHDAPDPTPSELRAILAALRDHVHSSAHILRLRLPAIAGHDPTMIDALAASEGFEPTSRAPGYRSVAIDLSTDEDVLMAALHGKWRNPLRNALKAGLQLDRKPIAELADRFHVLYEKVQKSKGFRPDIPPEFYYPLEGSDFAHDALIAHRDGKDLAGITLGRAGATETYLFGATTDAGRKVNAGHFLMWQAILYGRAHNLRWFDLGGIDTEKNPTVARFKLRTGGHEVVSAGPYEARPPGITPALVIAAEGLHRRLKGKS